MQYIPSSPAEVKSIVEAVNLKTLKRFTYLKRPSDNKLFLFKVKPQGWHDLMFTEDGLVFDGADPDAEIILTEPVDVPPGDPLYAGDQTLSFERQVRPGEVVEAHLVAMGIIKKPREKKTRHDLVVKSKSSKTSDPVIAKVIEANPDNASAGALRAVAEDREAPEIYDEVMRQAVLASAVAAGDLAEDIRLEEPLPAPGRDNVIELPAVKKRVATFKGIPLDVLKFCRKLSISEGCLATYRDMHTELWYGPIKEIKDYAGKSEKKGRYFTQGYVSLIRKPGRSGTTVIRHWKWLRKNGLTIRHRKGYPAIDKKGIRHSEKGYCSILELPYNLAHVYFMRRHPRKYLKK